MSWGFESFSDDGSVTFSSTTFGGAVSARLTTSISKAGNWSFALGDIYECKINHTLKENEFIGRFWLEGATRPYYWLAPIITADGNILVDIYNHDRESLYNKVLYMDILELV